MSLLERLDVPAAKSRFSSSATDSPRVAASSAQPAPVAPAPITTTSKRSSAIRASAARRCSGPSRLASFKARVLARGAMADYIGAIDQGTTSTRFNVFDRDGRIVAVDQREHEQIHPRAGWVEHDALEIWERTQEVIAGALAAAGIEAGEVAAIGIANQRETSVLWDRETGRPLHNAIVWQDTRT